MCQRATDIHELSGFQDCKVQLIHLTQPKWLEKELNYTSRVAAKYGRAKKSKERERERFLYIYVNITHIYIYIYTHIYIYLFK